MSDGPGNTEGPLPEPSPTQGGKDKADPIDNEDASRDPKTVDLSEQEDSTRAEDQGDDNTSTPNPSNENAHAGLEGLAEGGVEGLEDVLEREAKERELFDQIDQDGGWRLHFDLARGVRDGHVNYQHAYAGALTRSGRSNVNSNFSIDEKRLSSEGVSEALVFTPLEVGETRKVVQGRGRRQTVSYESTGKSRIVTQDELVENGKAEPAVLLQYRTINLDDVDYPGSDGSGRNVGLEFSMVLPQSVATELTTAMEEDPSTIHRLVDHMAINNLGIPEQTWKEGKTADGKQVVKPRPPYEKWAEKNGGEGKIYIGLNKPGEEPSGSVKSFAEGSSAGKQNPAGEGAAEPRPPIDIDIAAINRDRTKLGLGAEDEDPEPVQGTPEQGPEDAEKQEAIKLLQNPNIIHQINTFANDRFTMSGADVINPLTAAKSGEILDAEVTSHLAQQTMLEGAFTRSEAKYKSKEGEAFAFELQRQDPGEYRYFALMTSRNKLAETKGARTHFGYFVTVPASDTESIAAITENPSVLVEMLKEGYGLDRSDPAKKEAVDASRAALGLPKTNLEKPYQLDDDLHLADGHDQIIPVAMDKDTNTILSRQRISQPTPPVSPETRHPEPPTPAAEPNGADTSPSEPQGDRVEIDYDILEAAFSGDDETKELLDAAEEGDADAYDKLRDETTDPKVLRQIDELEARNKVLAESYAQQGANGENAQGGNKENQAPLDLSPIDFRNDNSAAKTLFKSYDRGFGLSSQDQKTLMHALSSGDTSGIDRLIAQGGNTALLEQVKATLAARENRIEPYKEVIDAVNNDANIIQLSETWSGGQEVRGFEDNDEQVLKDKRAQLLQLRGGSYIVNSIIAKYTNAADINSTHPDMLPQGEGIVVELTAGDPSASEYRYFALATTSGSAGARPFVGYYLQVPTSNTAIIEAIAENPSIMFDMYRKKFDVAGVLPPALKMNDQLSTIDIADLGDMNSKIMPDALRKAPQRRPSPFPRPRRTDGEQGTGGRTPEPTGNAAGNESGNAAENGDTKDSMVVKWDTLEAAFDGSPFMDHIDELKGDTENALRSLKRLEEENKINPNPEVAAELAKLRQVYDAREVRKNSAMPEAIEDFFDGELADDIARAEQKLSEEKGHPAPLPNVIEGLERSRDLLISTRDKARKGDSTDLRALLTSRVEKYERHLGTPFELVGAHEKIEQYTQLLESLDAAFPPTPQPGTAPADGATVSRQASGQAPEATAPTPPVVQRKWWKPTTWFAQPGGGHKVSAEPATPSVPERTPPPAVPADPELGLDPLTVRFPAVRPDGATNGEEGTPEPDTNAADRAEAVDRLRTQIGYTDANNAALDAFQQGDPEPLRNVLYARLDGNPTNQAAIDAFQQGDPEPLRNILESAKDTAGQELLDALTATAQQSGEQQQQRENEIDEDTRTRIEDQYNAAREALKQQLRDEGGFEEDNLDAEVDRMLEDEELDSEAEENFVDWHDLHNIAQEGNAQALADTVQEVLNERGAQRQRWIDEGGHDAEEIGKLETMMTNLQGIKRELSVAGVTPTPEEPDLFGTEGTLGTEDVADYLVDRVAFAQDRAERAQTQFDADEITQEDLDFFLEEAGRLEAIRTELANGNAEPLKQELRDGRARIEEVLRSETDEDKLEKLRDRNKYLQELQVAMLPYELKPVNAQKLTTEGKSNFGQRLARIRQYRVEANGGFDDLEETTPIGHEVSEAERATVEKGVVDRMEAIAATEWGQQGVITKDLRTKAEIFAVLTREFIKNKSPKARVAKVIVGTAVTAYVAYLGYKGYVAIDTLTDPDIISGTPHAVRPEAIPATPTPTPGAGPESGAVVPPAAETTTAPPTTTEAPAGTTAPPASTEAPATTQPEVIDNPKVEAAPEPTGTYINYTIDLDKAGPGSELDKIIIPVDSAAPLSSKTSMINAAIDSYADDYAAEAGISIEDARDEIVKAMESQGYDLTPEPAPPAGTETTAPPAGTETTAPPAGTETTAPPAGTETTAPPAGTETTAPPAGTETTAPPTGTETTAPPAGTETTAPPAGTETTAPPAGTETTAPPASGPGPAGQVPAPTEPGTPPAGPEAQPQAPVQLTPDELRADAEAAFEDGKLNVEKGDGYSKVIAEYINSNDQLAWEKPADNGVTKGAVIADMLNDFAQENNVDLPALKVGEIDANTLLEQYKLTPDQMQVLGEAMQTADVDSYLEDVKPRFEAVKDGTPLAEAPPIEPDAPEAPVVAPDELPEELKADWQEFNHDVVKGDTRSEIYMDYFKEHGDAFPGGNWSDGSHDTSKAAQLSNMWWNFQENHGVKVHELGLNDTVNFSDWQNFTSDEQRVFLEALNTTSYDDFAEKVLPQFEDLKADGDIDPQDPDAQGNADAEKDAGQTEVTTPEAAFKDEGKQIKFDLPNGLGEYTIDIPKGTTELNTLIDAQTAALQTQTGLPHTISQLIVTTSLDNGLQAQGINIDIPKPTINGADWVQELSTIPQFDAVLNQSFVYDGDTLSETLAEKLAPINEFRGWDENGTSLSAILTDMILDNIDNSRENGFDLGTLESGKEYKLTDLGVKPDQIAEYMARAFAENSAAGYIEHVRDDYINAKNSW